MLLNASFSLKNYEPRLALGAPYPDPLAARGFALIPLYQHRAKKYPRPTHFN